MLLDASHKSIIANLLPHAVHLLGVRANQVTQLVFAVGGGVINSFGQKLGGTVDQAGIPGIGLKFAQ